MQLKTVWLATLGLPVAYASFKDTSPFFALSTKPLASNSLDDVQIASSDQITSYVRGVIASCPSDSYIVISQPAAAARDFADGSWMPHLNRRLSQPTRWSTLSVPDVYGTVDTAELVRTLEEQCGAAAMHVDAATGWLSVDDVYPRVIKVDFPALTRSTEERKSKLLEHDSFLNALGRSSDERSTMIIYTTTPSARQQQMEIDHPAELYVMDDPFPSLHTGLRRDLSGSRTSSNSTSSPNVPLFEKYQFLTPGIFMGLLVGLVMLSILYIAGNAISSLEVSYMAFAKETGPHTQKQQH